MRTIGEMLFDRKVTRFDLQVMAMRDLTDVHLHPELPDRTEKAVRDPSYTPSESVSEAHRGQEKDKQEIIHRHSDMSRQEFAKLQDLIGQVKYLQNKVEELSKPKEKKPDIKYGYRGIR